MATNDKILQQVILEGGDDIIRQLKEVADAGQKAFSALGDAINQIGKVDVPTEAIQKNFKEVSDAGEAAFKRVADAAKAPIATPSTDAIIKDLKGIGDTGTAAFKQVADTAQSTPIALRIEQPQQALITLGGTAQTVFGDITGFVTGTAAQFDTLARSIFNVNTTLGKLTLGTSIAGFVKQMSDAVSNFSDIFSGTAVEKSLTKHAEAVHKDVFTALGKAIESRIRDVDEFRAGILNANDALDSTTDAFHRSIFGTAQFPNALDDVRDSFRGILTDAAKLDLSDKSTDIAKMTASLKMLGAEQGNVSDKTAAALHALGVAQSDTRNIFTNLAKGIQTQFEHIRKEIDDTTLTAQRNALAIKSTALSLESAQEHLNQLRSPQPESAAEKERLRLLGSQDEAAARLATRIKLEDEEKQAVLQLAQAQLASQQAQKTSADASANSLENVVKLVNNLVSGVTVLGPKINATAENIAKGFVASLGPAANKLASFDGSLKGLSTASSSVVPAMEKLADLFKGTGDAALNARIANILFGGSITKEVLDALSKGKQGLRDAFDLSQAIAGLKQDFSIGNLETFARQLQKIKDPAERLKIAVRELGDTFGTTLVENLNKVPGGIRNALAPFDDFVVKLQQDQEAAKRFNEAMLGLRKVFTDIGIASAKGTLDLGLFLAPFATPVITAFAEGIRGLGLDFRTLGRTLGAAVTPVVEDFFKIIQKQPDTTINTKWLLDLRDIVIDVGKVFKFVFNEVILPALASVQDAGKAVATAFNNLFGTDLTGNMIIVGALITSIVGGINSLAIAFAALFSQKGPGFDNISAKLKEFGIDIEAIKKTINDFLTGAWDALSKALAGKGAQVSPDFKWVADATTAIADFVKSIPRAVVEVTLLFTAISKFVGPGRLFKFIVAEMTGALGLLIHIAQLVTFSLGALTATLGAVFLSMNILAGAFAITMGAALAWIVAIGAAVVAIIIFRDEIGKIAGVVFQALGRASIAISKFIEDVFGIKVPFETILGIIAAFASVLLLSLIPAVRSAAIALTVGLVGALQTAATAAIAFSRILLLTIIPALGRLAIPIIAAVSAMALLLEAFNRFEKREIFAALDKEAKDLREQFDKGFISKEAFDKQATDIQRRLEALVGTTKTDIDKLKDFLQGIFKDGIIPEIKVPDIKGPENTDSVIDGLKNKWADGAKAINDIWKALFGDLAKTSSTPLPGPKVAATTTGDRGINAQPGSRGGGEAGPTAAEIDAAVERARAKILKGPFPKAPPTEEFKVQIDRDKLEIIPLKLLGDTVDNTTTALDGTTTATNTVSTTLDAASKALDQFNADLHSIGITVEDFKKTLSSASVPVTAGPGQPSVNIEQGAPATAEQLKKAADDVVLRELDDAINSLPQRIADALPVAQTTPAKEDVTLAELLDAINKLVTSGAKAGVPTSVVQSSPDFIAITEQFQKRIETFPAEFTADIREQLKLIFRGQAEDAKAELEKQIKSLEGTTAGNAINDEGITVLEGLKQQLSDAIHFIEGTIPPVTKELQALLDAEKLRQETGAPITPTVSIKDAADTLITAQTKLEDKIREIFTEILAEIGTRKESGKSLGAEDAPKDNRGLTLENKLQFLGEQIAKFESIFPERSAEIANDLDDLSKALRDNIAELNAFSPQKPALIPTPTVDTPTQHTPEALARDQALFDELSKLGPQIADKEKGFLEQLGEALKSLIERLNPISPAGATAPATVAEPAATVPQSFVDALRASGPLPVKVDATATPLSPEAAARENRTLQELEMLTTSFETGAGVLTEKGGGLFSSITDAVTSLTTFINSVITKVTTPPEGINARLAGAGVPESTNIENTTNSSLDKLITISVASAQAAESLTEIQGVIAAIRDAVATIRDAVAAILAKITPQQTAPQTAQQTTPTGSPTAVPVQAGVPQDLTQTLALSITGLVNALDIGLKTVVDAVTTGANSIIENQRGFSGELFNWLSAILSEFKLVPKASTSVAKDSASATPAGDGTTSVVDALAKLETILGDLKEGTNNLIAAMKLGFADLRSILSDGVAKLQTIMEAIKTFGDKLDLIVGALGAVIILLAGKTPASDSALKGNFEDWLKRNGPSSTNIDDRRDGSPGPDFIPFDQIKKKPPPANPPEIPIPGPTLANPIRWWELQHPIHDQSNNASDPTFVRIVDPVKVTPAAPDTQPSFLFPGLPLLNQPGQSVAPQPIASQTAPGTGPASSLEPSLSRIEQAINSAIAAINELSGKMGSALEPLFSNVIQAINSSQATINELSANMGSALEPLFSNLVQVINEVVATMREQRSAVDSAASAIVSAIEAGAQSIVTAIETASSGSGGTATELASGGFTGFVRGPGTKTSDSILARISRGEFVHRAAAVDKYGLGFFHSINNLTFPKFSFGGLINKDEEDDKLLPKFNLGGIVSNFNSPTFPKFSLPRFDMGGFLPHIGQLAMGSVPSFASGGSTMDLTDVGRPSSSSGRPLFLSIGGDKPVGPFTSSRDHAVDAVEKSAVKHRVTRIGPSPSWRTT